MKMDGPFWEWVNRALALICNTSSILSYRVPFGDIILCVRVWRCDVRVCRTFHPKMCVMVSRSISLSDRAIYFYFIHLYFGDQPTFPLYLYLLHSLSLSLCVCLYYLSLCICSSVTLNSDSVSMPETPSVVDANIQCAKYPCTIYGSSHWRRTCACSNVLCVPIIRAHNVIYQIQIFSSGLSDRLQIHFWISPRYFLTCV